MAEQTYIFIDGNYLEQNYNTVIRSIFGNQWEIDYARIKYEYGARRAFFYDCIDDVQRQGEATDDFERRVKSREDYFRLKMDCGVVTLFSPNGAAVPETASAVRTYALPPRWGWGPSRGGWPVRSSPRGSRPWLLTAAPFGAQFPDHPAIHHEPYFNSIRSLEGFRVRQGYVSSGKKRQQKEVDVLLAVDMMVHSFNRNMSKAVLISGDRDFKPVVESVAQSGTYVEVIYRKETGATALADESDIFTLLDITRMVRWTKVENEGERRLVFPSENSFTLAQPNNIGQEYSGATLVASGTVQTGKSPLDIRRYNFQADHLITVNTCRNHYTGYRYKDFTILVKYIESLYSSIAW